MSTMIDMRAEAALLGDALRLVRACRVHAYELKPGDQVFVPVGVPEESLCPNDSGYRLADVIDVRHDPGCTGPLDAARLAEVDEHVFHRGLCMTVDLLIGGSTSHTYCCSPKNTRAVKVGHQHEVWV